MHVVITGSRGWTDTTLIRDVADTLPPRSTVYVGGAQGVDTMFEGAARIRGHAIHVMRPKWTREDGSTDKGAGFARNLAMLDRLAFVPDDERRVIAFWLGYSRGTRHTIVNAMERGIPLDLHWRPDTSPA
jgi:hypothetical protein